MINKIKGDVVMSEDERVLLKRKCHAEIGFDDDFDIASLEERQEVNVMPADAPRIKLEEWEEKTIDLIYQLVDTIPEEMMFCNETRTLDEDVGWIVEHDFTEFGLSVIKPLLNFKKQLNDKGGRIGWVIIEDRGHPVIFERPIEVTIGIKEDR